MLCHLFAHLRFHLLPFLYGLDRPPSHAAVSPVRPVVVVGRKPCVEICLEFIEGEVEVGTERLLQEVVEDRPVEPLHEAVGPGVCHLRSSMFDVIEL